MIKDTESFGVYKKVIPVLFCFGLSIVFTSLIIHNINPRIKCNIAPDSIKKIHCLVGIKPQ